MHVELVDRTGVERAPDLVHRVRALSYFKRHVALGIAGIARHHGLNARFEERLATRVFLSWIDTLVCQKAQADVDRRDYIVFGAGMLLKTLIELQPIRVASPVTTDDDPVHLWPEGALATAYCVSVLDAVLTQEGFGGVRVSSIADDPATWQSFRENVAEDPRLAIPFFDLFLGHEPNWIQPTWARARAAQRASTRLPEPPRFLM